jgi:hypothetical protein
MPTDTGPRKPNHPPYSQINACVAGVVGGALDPQGRVDTNIGPEHLHVEGKDRTRTVEVDITPNQVRVGGTGMDLRKLRALSNKMKNCTP